MATALLIRSCSIPNDNAPPYAILESCETTIGRHGNIKMDTSRGKEVSKIHTKIYRRYSNHSAIWIIEDNNSLNGTFVNGRKIRSTTLKPFDEIVFGGGPGFIVGEKVQSTDHAECRYLFFPTPPSVHYRSDIKMVQKQDQETEELCPICYLPITGRETLPCGHSFCFTCLQEWSNVCAKKMRPCVCPMCRAPFSQSELDQKEYTLTADELRISFIEPLLNMINVHTCKEIRSRNIFKLWDDKTKQWFWESYNLVKKSRVRKYPFLDLTRANYKYIIQANTNQLSNAIKNLGGIPQNNREDMVVEVLRLVYTTFTQKPEEKKLSVNRFRQNSFWW